jgi:hypothetical protein
MAEKPADAALHRSDSSFMRLTDYQQKALWLHWLPRQDLSGSSGPRIRELELIECGATAWTSQEFSSTPIWGACPELPRLDLLRHGVNDAIDYRLARARCS